ncbi:MAG: hypothetical protein ABFE16_06750 [Armatimonadia bacterium]
MDDADCLDGELQPDEMGRLFETVRRELFLGRTSLAAQAAQELLGSHPDSTTAHELMGDVLAAQGKRSQAKEEYRKALDLEPANADAERKWAQVMLILGEANRTRALLESGRYEEIRGAVHKDPGGAAIRSMFFPGLGQLYNGEYEKGIVTVLVGLPLFGLALWGIVACLASVFPSSPEPMTGFDLALALTGIFGYGVLLVWSAWDAWQGGGTKKQEGPQEPPRP